MNKIPFSEDELKVVREDPGFMGGKVPVYNFPCTPKEAIHSLYMDKKPVWFPIGSETKMFCPSVIPDNIARGFVFEQEKLDPALYGGKDMFGVEWVYVEQVGGSMVKPGAPTLEDVYDWEDVLTFPDINAWDWEGSAKANAEFFNTDKYVELMLLNGCWFERLISFMDFEGAAMAVVDEEVEDKLHALLKKTTDLYISIIDKAFEVYPIDGINIHDDWGSQMAPFFSEEVARKYFLPEMKRLVDHVHAGGHPITLHSCGHNETRVNIFVEAGFDGWAPMAMNDCAALYENVGDKMVIGLTSVEPDIDADTATDEEIIAFAKEYAAKFTKPGKCATLGRSKIFMNELFKKTLYEESRKAYLEW